MMGMFGREKHLARLGELMDGAASGKGRIVFVSGEAGIGKTRLGRELERLCGEKGVTYLYGHCLFRDGVDPYMPFIEALRSSSSARGPGAGAAVAGGGLPVFLLAMRHGEDGPAGDDDMERLWRGNVGQERDRSQQTVFSALHGMAGKGPLLLFLDDMHWADSASLELLQHISRTVEGDGMLIVATYRPEELHTGPIGANPFKNLMWGMKQAGVAEEVQLGPLGRTETRMLLSSLHGTNEVDDRFAESLFGLTHGNPFFIEELYHDLLSRGVLEKGGPLDADLAKVPLPQTVKAVMSERISHVDEDVRAMLERASVIGQEFRLDVLDEISSMSEETLVEQLETLVRTNVLEEDLSGEKDRYRFCNNMLRDVIYNGLSNTKRRHLHGKIAGVIEGMKGPDSDEKVFQLALHYSHTRDDAKTMRYSFLAGNRAFRSFALDEAAGYYGTVLELLEAAEPSERDLDMMQETLLSLGSIHETKGDLDKAIKVLGDVLEIAESTGNTKLEAIGLLRMGNVHMMRSEFPLSEGYFERALELFIKTNDSDGQLRALQARAFILGRMGQHQKGLRIAYMAVELAKKARDVWNEAMATTLVAMITSETGDMMVSETNYLKGEELASGQDDPYLLCRIYNNLGDLRMRQWRYNDALPILEKAIAPAERSGNVRIMGYILCNYGECLVHIGRLEDARPHLENARAIFEKIDEKLMTSRMSMLEGVMHRKASRWTEARRCALESIHVAEEIDVPIAIGEYLMEYGVTCSVEGDRGTARSILERAAIIFKEHGLQKFLERTELEIKRLSDWM